MLKDDIVNHQNIQYQWLLVSSFEDYEVFLKEIYSYVICLKNKPNSINYLEYINTCDDIYNLIMENINKKNASKILIEIRRLLPKYKDIEIDNDMKHNMRFFLLLIQCFRNIIVHCYGKANDKNKLFDGIISSVGINGVLKDKYKALFHSYFPNDLDKITLLEIPVFETGDCIKAETAVLPNLFSVLLNSAYYIVSEIKEKYST